MLVSLVPGRRLRNAMGRECGGLEPWPCGEVLCGGGWMLRQSDVDRIVFGCGNFGGIGSSPDLRGAGDSEDRALQLLDHARRVGIRRFDTANTYGGGASEIMLGKWL